MKKLIYSMLVFMTMFAFTACEDVPAPYDVPSTTTESEDSYDSASGTGTADDPYNVVGALQLISTLGDATSDEVYVKGIIVSISEVSTSYGNATYVIADGTDSNQKLTIFRGYYLGGEKFTSEDQIKEGDTVVVKGTLVNYKGTTPEMNQGNQIVELNGKSASEDDDDDDDKGTGTANDPYNVVGALQLISTLGDATSDEVYVKGIIVSISSVSTSYGNATYDIADGTDSSQKLTIFRGYYLNGEKFTSEDQIKEGDTVVVKGTLVNYKGNTPEMNQGNQIVELNGKGTGSDDDDDDGVKTVTVSEFLAAEESTEQWYQLTGTVSGLKSGDQYGNFTITDATGSVYVYGLLSEKGGAKKQFQTLASEKGITEGCTITIIGNRGSYNGKDEVTNAYFVSVASGGSTTTTGDGTASSPYSVSQIQTYTSNLDADVTDSKEIYVKGIISSIKEVSTKYGNATYYISDDGTTSSQYMIYRGYYLNSEKFTSEDQIKVGDEVVICGKALNFRGNTPELAQGNYIYSLSR